MNLERAKVPAPEDRSPDAWAARRRAAQPRGSRSGRGGRILRPSTDAPELLAAADLRCPTGGDLLVDEPAAADPEHLRIGFPHWTRLGRVLPADLPRPGLRGGPAQRGSAGRDLVLSEATTADRAAAGNRAIGSVKADLQSVRPQRDRHYLSKSIHKLFPSLHSMYQQFIAVVDNKDHKLQHSSGLIDAKNEPSTWIILSSSSGHELSA